MKRETLYRHYNEKGELLYVGVTSRIAKRVKEHWKHSHWWEDISRIELEHFGDRQAVLDAERAAIISEKPKHNIHHIRRDVPDQKSIATTFAKENIVARIINLKPLYKMSEVGDLLNTGTTMVRKEIEAKRMGYIDLPSPTGCKIIRYVTGWQILDWLDYWSKNQPAAQRNAA